MTYTSSGLSLPWVRSRLNPLVLVESAGEFARVVRLLMLESRESNEDEEEEY